MSLTHEVARWIEEQPERRASFEQLRGHFDPQRLHGALAQSRRNGTLEYRHGVYHRTDRPLGESGGCHHSDADGYSLQVALRSSDQRFARLIGGARFEDVEVRREPMFRGTPAPRMSLVGSSSAMCAEQQPEMHDYQQVRRPGRACRETVRRMTIAGMSQKDIAAALNVGWTEVARAVREIHLGIA